MLPAFLTLPPEELAFLRLIADEATSRNLPAYIVGGFVRDLVMGHPSLDFDIVIVGDAIALARALARKHGGTVTAHPRFGTATWTVDSGGWKVENGSRLPSAIDLATARRESYARTAALPDTTPSTIEDDIGRRDFTINTLALRLDGAHFGELYDLYNGKADIERGLVRVLHPGSFLDDPTRLFRAVRYEQRYGFMIELQTLALVPAARPGVAQLSPERVRHELDLVFDETRAAQMLARLDELGLVKAVHEALPWSAALRERLERGLTAPVGPEWDLSLRYAGVPFHWVVGYTLWLLDLTAGEIDAAQARLAFPRLVVDSIRAAAQLKADLPALSGATPSQWVERLGGVPLSAIYAVFLVSGEKALEAYAVQWQHIRPKIDGEALKALGVPPGPAYTKILLRLRAAWLDGEVASAQQEKALLKKLLAALR